MLSSKKFQGISHSNESMRYNFSTFILSQLIKPSYFKYHYSWVLSQEKTFTFLWQFLNIFFPYFSGNSRKFLCIFVAIFEVFSAKIYFQVIRCCISRRGALGYHKFAKDFSTKIYFQAIALVFSCERSSITIIFSIITVRYLSSTANRRKEQRAVQLSGSR